MQKKTTIALMASAVALLAAGGIASADRGRNHGPQRMMMQMAERYDTNKDGKISQDEIDQNRSAWFTEFDADKNATLSLDEFKNLWLKARLEQMVREFQEFDPNGNGQVTLDEYKSPLSQMVANMDHNNDGVLSKDDHQAMKAKRRHHKNGAGMEQDPEAEEDTD